jgi:hypothetical protein
VLLNTTLGINVAVLKFKPEIVTLFGVSAELIVAPLTTGTGQFWAASDSVIPATMSVAIPR